MKCILTLVSVIILGSCAMTKKVDKKDTDTKQTEEIISSTKRQGDTVTFIPVIKYKDTTIYTYNRVGTRIETRYNDQGQIDRVDCFTSAIEELTQINRELIQNISEKEKDEEFKMDTTFVIVAGIVILIMFVILIAYVHSQIGGLKKIIG